MAVKNASRRILVPKPISARVKTNPDGSYLSLKIRTDKTRAFLKQDHVMPKGLSAQQKGIWLANTAAKAKYFIKPLSPRAKKIRYVLKKNGLKIEKAIQDLKNGTMLFERTGNSINSVKGLKIYFKNRNKSVEKIAKVIRKMHSLGITHNHLHIGNIAVTNRGTIVLLDFGKATISNKQRTQKGLNSKGKIYDLLMVSTTLARLEAQILKLNKKTEKKRLSEINSIFYKKYSKKEMLEMEAALGKMVKKS